MRRHHDDLRAFLLGGTGDELADQFQAGRAGHQIIDDEHVERIGQQPLGLAGVAAFDDAMPLGPQRAAQGLQYLFLVVNEKNRTRGAHEGMVPLGGRLGSSMSMIVPAALLWTASVPPRPSMMFLAIGKPSPVPVRRVVK